VNYVLKKKLTHLKGFFIASRYRYMLIVWPWLLSKNGHHVSPVWYIVNGRMIEEKKKAKVYFGLLGFYLSYLFLSFSKEIQWRMRRKRQIRTKKKHAQRNNFLLLLMMTKREKMIYMNIRICLFLYTTECHNINRHNNCSKPLFFILRNDFFFLATETKNKDV
jgi:CDP-diglyceride synthetase